MEKEFVPYELALKLKELGFNEPCLAYYYKHGNSKKEKLFYYPSQDEYDIDDHPYLELNSKTNNDAPLWQQAFDWFREEEELLNHITTHLQDIGEDGSLVESYGYRIMYNKDGYKCDVWEKLARFDTYEESRLECLKRLIELVESSCQKPEKIN